MRVPLDNISKRETRTREKEYLRCEATEKGHEVCAKGRGTALSTRVKVGKTAKRRERCRRESLRKSVKAEKPNKEGGFRQRCARAEGAKET